jgi:hypothetical protein
MGTRVASRGFWRPNRVWLAVAVGAFLVVAGVIVAQLGSGSSATSADQPGTSLPTRTVDAGAVTVKIQPRQFDASGATFKMVFDTHSVELDQDLNRQVRLVVGGIDWPTEGWSGDGPSGHHREGDLRFAAAGPAIGAATLTIDGLPAAVTATWDLDR